MVKMLSLPNASWSKIERQPRAHPSVVHRRIANSLTWVLVVLVHIDAHLTVAAVLIGRALLARTRIFFFLLVNERLDQARDLNEKSLLLIITINQCS